MKGRKRHLVVDALGLIRGLKVHSAGISDREGIQSLLERIRDRLPRMKLLWADGNYTGSLIDWVKTTCGRVLEIVPKPKDRKGFQALPRRWVVERTFAWCGKYRRLSKDYEATTASSEATIYGTMIHLMIRRLCPSRPP